MSLKGQNLLTVTAPEDVNAFYFFVNTACSGVKHEDKFACSP